METKNPKEWICKKCGLDMEWRNEKGEVVSPNYCDYCRSPDGDTHYFKPYDMDSDQSEEARKTIETWWNTHSLDDGGWINICLELCRKPRQFSENQRQVNKYSNGIRKHKF